MTTDPKISILGASGHAKVVASCLLAAGREIRGYFDDDVSKTGREILGYPVLGSIMDIDFSEGDLAIIGIGSNRVRQKLSKFSKSPAWTTAIHPTAWIDPSVSIGEGTVVFAGAVIQPGAKIGRHCILNTGCTIDHDCVIGDFVHIAPGVNLAGNVSIGEGTFLGIGTKAIPGISIGSWSQIGAGGVIVNDVPDKVLAIGVPAKVIRQRSEDDR